MLEQDVKVVIASSGCEQIKKQLEDYNDKRINIIHFTDDGEAIYDVVKETKPDVLLIDVFVSNTDGLEVVERIRDDEELSSVKIIFLSTVPTKLCAISEFVCLSIFPCADQLLIIQI